MKIPYEWSKKEFNSESLANVKMVHEGKKQYQCDICEKSFSEMGYLRAHQARLLFVLSADYQLKVVTV